MKLLRDTQYPIELNSGLVAAIGNFDGVHLGHQNLLLRLKEQADFLKLPLVVVLFEPQPREYFQGPNAPARLSSLREKMQILRSCQVDYVYCIKFNAKLAETEAEDFAKTYIFQLLKVQYLLIGEDFRFGKDRMGDAKMLKALGAQSACKVEVCPDFFVENHKVSSTKIRQALQAGDFALARLYLGRSYSLCGRVVKGDGRGRQWGIPTANISLQRFSLPLSGVYVVEVLVQGKMIQGVANIGKRPTVDGSKNVLEIHLFQFKAEIYGEMVQVFFLHKLRDEVKFTSVDALIEQIHSDIAAAKALMPPISNVFSE